MSRLDHWTPDELAAFLAEIRGTRLEAAWHLAAFGGLRTGELLALRWTDVDLDAARIDVRNAVVGVPYTAIKPPSTSRRVRAVDLHPGTVAILCEHRERQEAERSEWGSDYSDHDLVVCRESGEPLHPRSLSRALAQVAERAALRPIGLPAIRRTRAALAVQDGGAA